MHFVVAGLGLGRDERHTAAEALDHGFREETTQ